MVELGVVYTLSHATVRRTIKKKPTQASFERAMGHSAGAKRPLCREDLGVLSVYQRPYDPDRPVVCMDEMSR
jgi:hypothetical protein